MIDRHIADHGQTYRWSWTDGQTYRWWWTDDIQI